MPDSIVKAIFFLFLLGWVGTQSLYAVPANEAINASLKSLESTEELDQIRPLFDIKERYQTGYTTLYNRYQMTQEEYRKVEEKFEAAGIPLFFALIPYSESKFQPNAHGYGTAGLWQLTKQSARNFGLTVQKKRDERLNAGRSTDAIIRLLLSLKKEFGTWYLADFAYASGEGTLRRLIEKNKTTKLSVLLKDPHFPSGAKSQFAKTLLLDAKIHYTKEDPSHD
ncbi:MAG: transglycosylase SLT domain-containing protein [Sulfuricurvum sp.]|jgi:membrane-bound lytic murein transglycosylase D|uniref:transglycosylase SLT domain-containing protein n=1 Tax=Sulfuricurvum sp. TaxID=2025608 RepID=UPI0025DDD687|nr:transglycosylase SLT domain-containing protein [Sulfuricurvum sp.]MCK9373641.1 transglycosylase SLT domain-containing protein [Sulfuricurvum sp.]